MTIGITDMHSRGKKIFRRFDDSKEEEEVIDEDDLGLLAHTGDGASRIRPLRTLTRKSIRPTRLFQKERQKHKEEERTAEEALTDVEDDTVVVTQEHDSKKEATETGSTRKGRKSQSNGIERPSRASPFDAWPRIKAGSRPSSATKGHKRGAAEALEEDDGDALPLTGTVGQNRTRG